MAMEGLRGYLQLASGLAETSRTKAIEAASALLSLSSGLSGDRSGRNVQLQVQDLAEELLAAAAANRRSLIALVRGEVDRAMANSPIPPDELDRARAAVAKLSADVEELRAQVLAHPAVGEVVAKLGLAGYATSRPVQKAVAGEARGVASSRPQSAEEGLVVDAALTAPVEEPPSAPPRRRPPRRAVAEQAGTGPVPEEAVRDMAEEAAEPRTEAGMTTEPAATTSPAKSAVTTGAATETAPTKKSATKKSASKKSASKKSASKKSATKGSTTNKAAGRTAAAQKAGTKKSAVQKGATQKAAAKTAATRKTTTTKATPRRTAIEKSATKSAAKAAKAAPAGSAGTS
jgi:hypothetical protein